MLNLKIFAITPNRHAQEAQNYAYGYISKVEPEAHLKEIRLIPRERYRLFSKSDKENLMENSHKTYTGHIDQNIGYGLFAGVFIPAQSFIGEYTGILERQGPFFYPYAYEYPSNISGQPLIVNAAEYGNEFRLMNDSLYPNCEIIFRDDPDYAYIRLMVRTLTAIEPDTQLTHSYGPDYWKSMKKSPLPQ